MTIDAQSRRLRELLEVLAGQRGNEGKRAVLVDELRALETRVNAIINTKATGAIAGAVEQISGDLAELDVRIQAALAEGQAANAAASAVADDLTAEAAALRTEMDALTVDYIAAQEAATTAVTAAQTAVDAKNAAGASASASADNATAAGAKADEASQWAAAASDSATNASTSEASASTFAAQASTAATNAGTSAAAAATSQQLTASITSRGISVIEEQFLSDISTSKWSRWSNGGSLTVLNNEVYPIGKTWRFTLAIGQESGMETQSNDAQWRGPTNADAYYVEVEFTLVSGSLDASGVVFQWISDAGTFKSEKTLASMMSGALIAGNVHVASGVFRKPANFAGTFSYNRIYVMAGWSTFGAVPAKVIKFHRVTIRPATAEEQGLGEVATQIDAKVANEAAVRASEDQALATQISTVSASVGSLSADVTSQANAIADLEGNAAAMLAFRVKAGTSGAQLELIAADNPDGSVSVARIDATNILLNGSVTASQLAANSVTADKINVSSLSAISATIGTFESASSGARLVIQDDRLVVYDSNNVVRVKIGNLA